MRVEKKAAGTHLGAPFITSRSVGSSMLRMLLVLSPLLGQFISTFLSVLHHLSKLPSLRRSILILPSTKHRPLEISSGTFTVFCMSCQTTGIRENAPTAGAPAFDLDPAGLHAAWGRVCRELGHCGGRLCGKGTSGFGFCYLRRTKWSRCSAGENKRT